VVRQGGEGGEDKLGEAGGEGGGVSGRCVYWQSQDFTWFSLVMSMISSAAPPTSLFYQCKREDNRDQISDR
jgi:hypothetical protein